MLTQRENDDIAIQGNNVLLDVISFPPHSIKSDRYEEMIDYFITQDCIHLENKRIEYFKQGDVCIKCNDGHLECPRTKEIFEENNYKRKIVFWKCDSCGFEYQGINVYI